MVTPNEENAQLKARLAELEAQLRRAQKLEAVGRLASGIAHDFNNVLTAVETSACFALEELDENANVREDLLDIRRSVSRATALTRKLLAFSRESSSTPCLVELNAVVADIQRTMVRLVGADVKVVTRLAERLWSVKVDPSGIDQLLMNLVVNSRDAMPNGGTLTVETTNVGFDAEVRSVSGIVIPKGEYVMLAVGDDGVGIPDDVREHIFEPFFTTKAPGEGTGLGLSVCSDIVGQAGGFIDAYSEFGSGTTFRIYLPRARGVKERETPVLAPVVGGTERVLVAENDERIRSAMVRTLRGLGYELVELASLADAEAVLHSKTADLLVTDVMVPGRAGPEVVADLRRVCPGLRVLYVSGSAGGGKWRDTIIESGDVLLEKPFAPSDLARAVREALSTSDRRGYARWPGSRASPNMASVEHDIARYSDVDASFSDIRMPAATNHEIEMPPASS